MGLNPQNSQPSREEAGLVTIHRHFAGLSTQKRVSRSGQHAIFSDAADHPSQKGIWAVEGSGTQPCQKRGDCEAPHRCE